MIGEKIIKKRWVLGYDFVVHYFVCKYNKLIFKPKAKETK